MLDRAAEARAGARAGATGATSAAGGNSWKARDVREEDGGDGDKDGDGDEDGDGDGDGVGDEAVDEVEDEEESISTATAELSGESRWFPLPSYCAGLQMRHEADETSSGWRVADCGRRWTAERQIGRE